MDGSPAAEGIRFVTYPPARLTDGAGPSQRLRLTGLAPASGTPLPSYSWTLTRGSVGAIPLRGTVRWERRAGSCRLAGATAARGLCAAAAPRSDAPADGGRPGHATRGARPAAYEAPGLRPRSSSSRRPRRTPRRRRRASVTGGGLGRLVSSRPRRPRSTTSPLVSLTVAASTTTARALPRATSPTSIGTWPPSTTAWANWSGVMPEEAARRMRCSVSSSWLTFSFSLLTSSSRTNWVLMPLIACSSVSASNSSLGLALDLQVLLEVEAHLAELVVLQVVLAGLDLVLEQLLGDRAPRPAPAASSRTRSWAWVAWSYCFMFSRRLRLSALQLLEGVELAGQLGELVVQLGEFTGGDLR